MFHKPSYLRNFYTFVLGVLLNEIFAPFYFLALLPLVVFLLLHFIEQSENKKQAFWAGWWFAFGHFLVGFYWFIPALTYDISHFGWMLPFAVIGVPAYIAVWYGLAVLAAYAMPGNRLAKISVFTVGWILAEAIRSPLPWNLLGYSGMAWFPLMQSASVVGIYGVGAILLFTAATFYTRDWKVISITVLALVSIGIGGKLRLEENPSAGYYEAITLRLVQPNIVLGGALTDGNQQAIIAGQIAMSVLPGYEKVTHILWPENALPYRMQGSSPWPAVFAQIVPEGGKLIFGADREQQEVGGVGGYQYWNSLFVLDREGAIEASYDKFHIVPFGEYIPLRGWFPWLSTVTGANINLQAGERMKTLHVEGLPPFSPLICFDAVFTSSVVDRKDPPVWMLNITNDAWSDGTTAPYQHYDQIRVRAIEYGLPLVRVANTGKSAVIDAYGREIQSLPHREKNILDTQLPRPLPAHPPYFRYGHGMVGGMLLLLLLYPVWVVWRVRGGSKK